MRLRLTMVLLLAALLSAGAAPARSQGLTMLYLPLLANLPGPARLVADLAPGFEDSLLPDSSFHVAGDTLVFTRFCAELWAARDGVATLLRTFPRENAPGCPIYVEFAGPRAGELFFIVRRSFADSALWRSDGTAAGTYEVTPIAPSKPGATNVLVYGLTAVGGALTFIVQGTARSGDTIIPIAFELWRSDGTAAGTARLDDMPAPGANRLKVLGGRLFFALRKVTGDEIWAHDGAPGSARLLASGPVIRELAVSAGRLWFTLERQGSFELWASDGTPDGTRPVRAMGPYAPTGFSELRGRTYFTVTAPPSTDSQQLWATDGTAEGTVKIFDAAARALTPHGRALFFVSGARLHRSDGTPGGTAEVSPAPIVYGSPYSAGDLIYFAGYEPASGVELWASDSTAAGTREVQEIRSGDFGANPSALTRAGATLYFVADDDEHGEELWALALPR